MWFIANMKRVTRSMGTAVVDSSVDSNKEELPENDQEAESCPDSVDQVQVDNTNIIKRVETNAIRDIWEQQRQYF